MQSKCGFLYYHPTQPRLKNATLVDVRINRSSALRQTEVGKNTPEGTRLIQVHNDLEGGVMRFNQTQINKKRHFCSVQDQARSLMTQNRHRQQNRQVSMLQRATF